MTVQNDSADRASEPGGAQLSLDFGAWGITADAIHRAMLRAREARDLPAKQIAKAIEAVRTSRREHLEREGVRVFLSEFDATIVIFDGEHRAYERDNRDGYWRLRHRGSASIVDSPWAPFDLADLGNPEVQRLVFRVRDWFAFEIESIKSHIPNFRLSRHYHQVFSLPSEEPPTKTPDEWFARNRPDVGQGQEVST